MFRKASLLIENSVPSPPGTVDISYMIRPVNPKFALMNRLRKQLKARVFTRQNLGLVLLIAAIPVIIFWARDVLDPGTAAQAWTHWLSSAAYSLLFTASLFYGCFSLTVVLNHYLPWEAQPWKRLGIELGLLIGYATLVQLLIILGGRALGLFEPQAGESFSDRYVFDQVLFGIAITLIVVAIFEGVSFFKKWQESQLQAERLRAEHLQSQYANLRSQLDPHFMFNSLNVLSSLIRKSPPQAEAYLDHFAQVYRKVLETKDETLIPLEEELAFVDSYLELQRIRFGPALRWEDQRGPGGGEALLPPLSLQELLNNALKHNKMSVQKPLQLELSRENGWLYLRNSDQPKAPLTAGDSSTGTGWDNLKARYRLLDAPEPHYWREDGWFVAALPLISPAS